MPPRGQFGTERSALTYVSSTTFIQAHGAREPSSPNFGTASSAARISAPRGPSKSRSIAASTSSRRKRRSRKTTTSSACRESAASVTPTAWMPLELKVAPPS